jgi:hypothetical protein
MVIWLVNPLQEDDNALSISWDRQAGDQILQWKEVIQSSSVTIQTTQHPYPVLNT